MYYPFSNIQKVMQIQLVKINFSIWINLQEQQKHGQLKNYIMKILLEEKF